MRGLADEWKPNRPSTYVWTYSPSAVTELVPVPPEPHYTYDSSTDWVQQPVGSANRGMALARISRAP